MRVAVLSYPMLFQTNGGLKMKVHRTVEALKQSGVDACIVDATKKSIKDYELVHVFACHQGTFRIVQQAKSDGIPVVLSTILNPPFSRLEGFRARLLSRAVGSLSRWTISTTYDQISTGIKLADRLIALGENERRMLVEGYQCDEKKIKIIHNGIGAEFFNSEPDLFRSKYNIKSPFVLHTGLIGEVKNQLGLIRALRGVPCEIVLIGRADSSSQGYLEQCKVEGGDRVHHLGELPHGVLLASAYAAATVIAIPSRHEGMPNTVLEGLASGRPVVMTNNHSMDLELPTSCVAQVSPDDYAGIRSAVQQMLVKTPSPDECVSVVSHLSWTAVANQLIDLYRECLDGSRRELIS